MDGLPWQDISPAGFDHLNFVDFGGTTSAEASAELTGLTESFLAEVVDLSVGPLFQVTLLRLSPHEHVLLVGVDHMVSDGVSNAALLRELWTVYAEAVTGIAAVLPPVVLQFPDYAAWREVRYEAWRIRHDTYWMSHLAGAPCIEPPVVNAVADAGPAHGMRRFSFGRPLSSALEHAACSHGIRLPLVVLALYVATLSCWCHLNDFIVPVVSHGRSGRPELAAMIGFVASELYLRARVCDQDTLAGLSAHMQVEFEVASRAQDPGRIPDLMPECSPELSFNWQDTTPHGPLADDPIARTGLMVRPHIVKGAFLPEAFAPFFFGSVAGIGVVVHYRPNRVPPSSVDRFGRILRSAAERFVRTPAAPIAELR